MGSCNEFVAKHGVGGIVLRLDGGGEHTYAGCPRIDELYLQAQLRVIVVGGIWEVEHLHAHRPVAVEVERLARRHTVAVPLYQSLALCCVKADERVGQEVGVRQVAEVGGHVFGHALQVLHTGIGLNLCADSGGGCQPQHAK